MALSERDISCYIRGSSICLPIVNMAIGSTQSFASDECPAVNVSTINNVRGASQPAMESFGSCWNRRGRYSRCMSLTGQRAPEEVIAQPVLFLEYLSHI